MSAVQLAMAGLFGSGWLENTVTRLGLVTGAGTNESMPPSVRLWHHPLQQQPAGANGLPANQTSTQSPVDMLMVNEHGSPRLVYVKTHHIDSDDKKLHYYVTLPGTADETEKSTSENRPSDRNNPTSVPQHRGKTGRPKIRQTRKLERNFQKLRKTIQRDGIFKAFDILYDCYIFQKTWKLGKWESIINMTYYFLQYFLHFPNILALQAANTVEIQYAWKKHIIVSRLNQQQRKKKKAAEFQTRFLDFLKKLSQETPKSQHPMLIDYIYSAINSIPQFIPSPKQ